MSLYEYDDYKAYVLERIREMPKRGRGQFKKIAETLGVRSTMISHVFKGDLHINLEHAAEICLYFGLSDLETEYFLVLVQQARSGTVQLTSVLEKQKLTIRKRGEEIRQRVGERDSISENDKATYYSEWFYSAIRLLTAIPEYRNIDIISENTGLSKKRVNQVVEFLLNSGLCSINDNQLNYAVKSTHIDAKSPLVNRHHKNWRMKSIERFEELSGRELVFTAPVVLSNKDQAKIRRLLLDAIEGAGKIFDPSPSEKLCCLNIDWIEVLN